MAMTHGGDLDLHATRPTTIVATARGSDRVFVNVGKRVMEVIIRAAGGREQ